MRFYMSFDWTVLNVMNFMINWKVYKLWIVILLSISVLMFWIFVVRLYGSCGPHGPRTQAHGRTDGSDGRTISDGSCREREQEGLVKCGLASLPTSCIFVSWRLRILAVFVFTGFSLFKDRCNTNINFQTIWKSPIPPPSLWDGQGFGICDGVCWAAENRSKKAWISAASE